MYKLQLFNDSGQLDFFGEEVMQVPEDIYELILEGLEQEDLPLSKPFLESGLSIETTITIKGEEVVINLQSVTEWDINGTGKPTEIYNFDKRILMRYIKR